MDKTTEMLDKAEHIFWKDGGTRDQMCKTVDRYIESNRTINNDYKNYVDFSAWPSDYRNNLEEVAIVGRVKFYREYETFFGNKPMAKRVDYMSEVFENPTWLQVTLLANDMINSSGDNHHIFLEAIREDTSGKFAIDKKSFIKIYNFSMGS